MLSLLIQSLGCCAVDGNIDFTGGPSLSHPCIIMELKHWKQWVAATSVVMVPTFTPVKCHPLIKPYIKCEDCLLKPYLKHAWHFPDPADEWSIGFWIGPLFLKPPHSAHYTYESAEFEFQSVPVVDIFPLRSLTVCWCTFMLQFMTLSWLFSEYNKENNKSTVYMFSQYPGCKAEMYCHRVKACVAIRATCMAIQYTHMIYGTPPSPLRFPSTSAAIITLNSIFLVRAAWIDAPNLFTFRQILNRRHQTTE